MEPKTDPRRLSLSISGKALCRRCYAILSFQAVSFIMARSLAFSAYTSLNLEVLLSFISFCLWRHRRAFLLFLSNLQPAEGSIRRMLRRSCLLIKGKSIVKSPILTMSPPGKVSFYSLALSAARFFKSIIGVSYVHSDVGQPAQNI